MIKRNFALVFCLLIYSISYSQTVLENKNINLELSEASLIKVIKAIETQSGVSFVYNTTVMKNAQKVSIDVNDVDLSILLETICNKSGNSYRVINNQVVFFKVKAATNESIKILIKPKAQSTLQNENTVSPVSESTAQTTKTVPNPNSTIDPGLSYIDLTKDSINPIIRETNFNNGIEPISPIIAETATNNTLDNSIILSKAYNINEQNNKVSKARINKFFYSLQINSFLCMSPGFKSSDSLNSENAQTLNKSMNSYGYRASINIGYTIKNISIKSGLVYTLFNESLTEIITYHQFVKETDWQVITWQELSSDGIAVYTDSIPISQTEVKDSTVTFANKYTYKYIEIPFNIDYSFTHNPKWNLFSSLGITYAIALKNNLSTHPSVYKPKAVNKLDISAELNVGLKFCSNRLQYYFMIGAMTRSTWAPKDNLIRQNPVYLNFALGFQNYF